MKTNPFEGGIKVSIMRPSMQTSTEGTGFILTDDLTEEVLRLLGYDLEVSREIPVQLIFDSEMWLTEALVAGPDNMQRGADGVLRNVAEYIDVKKFVNQDNLVDDLLFKGDLTLNHKGDVVFNYEVFK